MSSLTDYREIPVKKKHLASKGLYGYPRQHNGRNAKKIKKLGGNGVFQPYDKRAQCLILLSNMKTRMLHGEAARLALKD